MKENEETPEKKKRGLPKGLKGFLIRAGIIAGAVIVFFCFFGIHVYHGNNMITSLRDGEFVIVSKTSAPIADRVIAYRADNETRFARVVGLPGDKIEITKNKYTINGSVPTEQVFFDTRSETEVHLNVPENHVFVLNDHREDERDSRTYGAIPYSDIKGVVIFTMARRGF